MKCCVFDRANSNKVEERDAISMMMRCVCYCDNNNNNIIMYVVHTYNGLSDGLFVDFIFIFNTKVLIQPIGSCDFCNLIARMQLAIYQEI